MVRLTSKQILIAEEAAGWFLKLENEALLPEDKSKFADWLRESPVHIQEFLFAVTTYRALDSISSTSTDSFESFLNQSAPEIIPLFTTNHENLSSLQSVLPHHSLPRPSPIRSIGAALLALVLGVFLFASYSVLEGGRPLVISTGIGEQKSTRLDDGSIVYLNTKSRVAVILADGERSVDLIEGEALFEVAHDPSRPFRVHVGGSVVEAIGTAFNIYKQYTGAHVAVVEGKIAVTLSEAKINSPREAVSGLRSTREESAKRGTTVLVSAGEETTILENGNIQPVKAFRQNAVLAWRDRRLVFEGDRLIDIAHEFNRYNQVQIRVVDPELQLRRFDGVFDADSPEAFVRFLEATGDVNTHRSSNREIWLQPS